MKKVLITGISGFVGRYLAEYLLSRGEYGVIGTYRSDDGLKQLNDLKDRIKLERIDLLNASSIGKVIVEYHPDYICHLAAATSPAASFKNPQMTITNNVLSELNILDTLRATNLKHLRTLIISTSEIYGLIDKADLPVDEDTPLRPINPYAVSKITQDFLALQYHLSYKLDIVRVRPFNHTGPGQGEAFVVPAFAKQIAEIEKGKKEPVIIVGNLDAKRDFTDVRDMVKAYELVLRKGEAGAVYNIGSGKSQKIKDILDTFLSLTDKKIKVEYDVAKSRPLDIPDVYCDVTRFHAVTGWKPEIPFEQTLKDTLDYWRNIV